MSGDQAGGFNCVQWIGAFLFLREQRTSTVNFSLHSLYTNQLFVVPVEGVPAVRVPAAGRLHHLLHHGSFLQIRRPGPAGQGLHGGFK